MESLYTGGCTIHKGFGVKDLFPLKVWRELLGLWSLISILNFSITDFFIINLRIGHIYWRNY